MPADAGRWALDLSAAGLWSQLNHWGRTGKLLSVSCDESKPLKSIAGEFTGGDDDPGIRSARQKHNPEPLGWKLLEPVAFVDSRNHPAVQLADVIASTAFTLFSKGLPGCDAIAESIGRHGHPHSILPDMDVINPANRSAAVNALIVYDLAKRAERRGDPYENLEAMYHLAEVSWARGDYELIRKGSPEGRSLLNAGVFPRTSRSLLAALRRKQPAHHRRPTLRAVRAAFRLSGPPHRPTTSIAIT